MNGVRLELLAAVLFLLVVGVEGRTDAQVAPDDPDQEFSQDGYGGFARAPRDQPPSELTLRNFFSAGWDQEWVKRRRLTGTPDMALLRVQTNFLEREFRANYFLQDNIHSTKRKDFSDFDALIAWGFNRRLMLGLAGAYQWADARLSPDLSGGTPSLAGRIQLVDTEPSSYSLNFRVAAPNKGLGEEQTIFSYGLAGFQDLAYWLDLDRVGLYYSVLFNSLSGPAEPGDKRADVAYDLTIAKTLTAPDTPLLGNLTVFLENFAQTNLDGVHAGRTLVSLTPGVRFNLGKSGRVNFGKDNWLMFGVDIPVAGPTPWDAVYRFTYIKNL